MFEMDERISLLRLSSSDTLFYYRSSGKTVLHKYEVANGIMVRRTSLDAKWISAGYKLATPLQCHNNAPERRELQV